MRRGRFTLDRPLIVHAAPAGYFLETKGVATLRQIFPEPSDERTSIVRELRSTGAAWLDDGRTIYLSAPRCTMCSAPLTADGASVVDDGVVYCSEQCYATVLDRVRG